MIGFTLAVLWTLTQLASNPTSDPAIALDNKAWFPWFLGFFLCVFAATGIGNGSAYKMIPAIWRNEVEVTTAPDTPERASALKVAMKESSATLGVVGASGALGGFLIPLAFAAPWVDNPLSATKGAFLAFTFYYVVCAVVCYVVYIRRGARTAHLADARI